MNSCVCPLIDDNILANERARIWAVIVNALRIFSRKKLKPPPRGCPYVHAHIRNFCYSCLVDDKYIRLRGKVSCTWHKHLRLQTYTCSSLPLSINEWQQPPAWSCCSKTNTFFPAFARSAAVDRPPIPLPMTMASRFSGTFRDTNPRLRTLSRCAWSNRRGSGDLRQSKAKGFAPRLLSFERILKMTSGMITTTKIVKAIKLKDKFVIKETRNSRNFSTSAIIVRGTLRGLLNLGSR